MVPSQNGASTQSSVPAAVSTHILFIGDSLTAGYGVRKEEAFPALIEKKLRESGRVVKVTNAGISGSITAEADRRLRWFLKAKPTLLFLSLGANDAFKGTPPAVIKSNLKKAIQLAEENKIPVVLGGVRIFTNFGPKYTAEFEKVYQELAREHRVTFIPFILEGVALNKSLNLPDGKHPNANGHERVAETVLRYMEPLL
ncbi:MAG: arylesterase [Bdellovibrionaceae bacterium]|nr:arylesterase [Pseudobdellovibrionaceae bacterium]